MHKVRRSINISTQLKLLLSIILTSFLITACAAPKVDPVFFPEEPAPPRIQLLMSFNSEDDLDSNFFKKEILGDMGGNTVNKAFGLDFYNGNLYIADSGKPASAYIIVDFKTKEIKRYETNLQKAIDISVDRENGDIYVSDTLQKKVIVFNNNNQYLRSIKFDDPRFRPVGVRVVSDKLYVTDIKLDSVRVFDKTSGQLLKSFGREDGLGWPHHIALAPDDKLIITETGPATLRIYDQAGNVLGRIGEPGDRIGTFARPKATAVDKDGNVYAVDVAFQNVQILGMDGTPKMYFGMTGDQNSLIMPAGIAIDYESAPIFQEYAAPGFTIEYVIAVSSQGSPNAGSKINIYGFGRKEGADYSQYGE